MIDKVKEQFIELVNTVGIKRAIEKVDSKYLTRAVMHHEVHSKGLPVSTVARKYRKTRQAVNQACNK